ncbi:flagellar hook-associated protein FlgK [Vibrio furnissii]|uniref:flagellar hook-associated protein FlgK n=1 Tax=Vibrio furnissii TaxID=29494 RepID=UPI003AA9B271
MSMYNIALSGAMANQVAMNVTAQNTANINSAGYSRKVVDQSAVIYGNAGPNSAGSGVSVTSIRRVSDQAAVERLRSANTELQHHLAFMSGMKNIESVLGMEGLNVSLGLNDFFAALEESTLSPESLVYRTQVLANAKSLSARFNGTMNQLSNHLNTAIQQQSTTLTQVNSQLQNVATLNEQIRLASAKEHDISAYQDALDTELSLVSQSMGINVLYNQDGTVELATQSGQPLVVGSHVAQLSVDTSSGDKYSTEITVRFNGESFAFKDPKGGELGAIDILKNEQYLPIMAQLNDMAAGFADAVNALLMTGTDLNGNPGQPLFTYDPANPASTLSVSNITAAELAFSSNGSVGNADIATELAKLANQPIDINGEQVNIYDVYAQMLGTVGVVSQKAQGDYKAAMIGLTEAQSARDSISAVSSNEEAANLMMYMNAYSANMKVIATANQMFDTVLNSF